MTARSARNAFVIVIVTGLVAVSLAALAYQQSSSPQRESAQTKMVSFAVQTRAPGVRKPCTTPESYVKQE